MKTEDWIPYLAPLILSLLGVICAVINQPVAMAIFISGTLISVYLEMIRETIEKSGERKDGDK